MSKSQHTGRGASTAPHLRIVYSESNPPPPKSIDDYRTPPRDDGYGKIPSNPIQEMQRRKALRDLRVLHRLRRINEPFEMWTDGDDSFDVAKLYSPHVLGQKTMFTVAEDIAFKVTTGRFPCIHPCNETVKETRNRRHAFNVKSRRKPVNTAAVKSQGVSRLQSLINALPAAPGRTTVKEIAAKLRNHPAWRDRGNGVKLELKSIVVRINAMAGDSPDLIGSEIIYTPFPTRMMWRKSR
jgi:hypothetical protein